MISAIIQLGRHKTESIKWHRCTRAEFRLFTGIAHSTTRWPQTNFHGHIPSQNQYIEASERHFVQCSGASAVAGRWRRVSQQLDDGCHGDRSFAIASVYIADYCRIFSSVAESPDERLKQCHSTAGHAWLIICAPSDTILQEEWKYAAFSTSGIVFVGTNVPCRQLGKKESTCYHDVHFFCVGLNDLMSLPFLLRNWYWLDRIFGSKFNHNHIWYTHVNILLVEKSCCNRLRRIGGIHVYWQWDQKRIG